MNQNSDFSMQSKEITAGTIENLVLNGAGWNVVSVLNVLGSKEKKIKLQIKEIAISLENCAATPGG